MDRYSRIPAQLLRPIDPSKGVVLDVRTEMEHVEKRLGFPHVHVPLDELDPTDFMTLHGLGKDAEVYILCRSGKRAAQAAEKFVAEGYSQVKVVEGGILSCEECGHEMKGYAIVSPDGPQLKAPISLERQVRIVAGILVALGAALALTVSPLFALVPLFIGLGLFMNGLSGWCGMALLLAKAPWNCVCSSSSRSLHKKSSSQEDSKASKRHKR